MKLVVVEEEFESKKDGCPYDKVTLAHALMALGRKHEEPPVRREACPVH